MKLSGWTGLASNGLCVEIDIRRLVENLTRFVEIAGLGRARYGGLDLVEAERGVFGAFGGQFGSIFHYFALLGALR